MPTQLAIQVRRNLAAVTARFRLLGVPPPPEFSEVLPFVGRADDEDGEWVTINGTHVFIGKDGTIEKGPKEFIGKSPDNLGGGKGSGKTEVVDGASASFSDKESWHADVKDRQEAAESKSGADAEKESEALGFMAVVLGRDESTPLSQRQYWRFAYSTKDGELVAAGSMHLDSKDTASVRELGSTESGHGAKVMGNLEGQARDKGISTMRLEANDKNQSFYSRLGYSKSGPGSGPDSFMMSKSLGKGT